jgi:hypothetical protein
MKTSSLPIISFLVALAAAIFLPISAIAASVLLTVTGVLAILAADYGRTIEPVRAAAAVVPFEAPHRSAPVLGRAA